MSFAAHVLGAPQLDPELVELGADAERHTLVASATSHLRFPLLRSLDLDSAERPPPRPPPGISVEIVSLIPRECAFTNPRRDFVL